MKNGGFDIIQKIMKNFVYKRVFILGLDGIGNSPKTVDTPNINRIVKNGVFTYDGKSVFPPISGECWGSMLHGVGPKVHGLNNGIAEQNPWPNDSPIPSVFKYVRNSYKDAVLASFSNWNPINFGMIESNIGVHFESTSDDALTDSLCAYLEHNDPTLVFLDLDDCDLAGHTHGWFTDEYFEQIKVTDKHIGRILDVIEKRGWFEDSLVMIVTDHGGGGEDLKDHHADHPMDMTVFFACMGKTIPVNKEIKSYTLPDVAAITLWALGIDLPSNFEGVVPKELL